MASSASFRVRLYSRATRTAATALVIAAALAVPVLVALVLFASDPPILPAVLWQLFAVLVLLPAAAVHLLRRGSRAQAHVYGDALVLERARLHVEIPLSAIARVACWRLPLPEPGLSIRLRSGRRLGWGVGATDPSPVVAALAEAGVEGLAVDAPALRHAHWRARHWRPTWPRLAGKFPLFALLPTTVLFVTHQWIAYGGPRGQYLLQGLTPYVATFATYWLTVTIYLVLYAGLWRGVAEAGAFALTHLAPERAALVRRGAEAVCRLVYFVGVPLLLALRYRG